MQHGLSVARHTDAKGSDAILFSRITLMSDDGVDRDQLIKELLAESFALRTKSEHLSQYVETKIAELVKTKRELDSIKNNDEIGQLRAGIETANQQRNELQAKLDALVGEHEHLEEVHVQMTGQRDRLRERMAQVDASPEYRLAKRLKRIFGAIFKDDTTK
jgi:predicted  nucleic acid-binding Zn-ribbon protein